MTAAVALLLGGVLERHPGLRVAFLESGTGWLPYWLARLDEHREWMEDTECAGLSLTPREYFARQCVISSDPEDTLTAFVIGTVGADHVMWASDFPHPDAHFPDAVDVFLARPRRRRRGRAPGRPLGHTNAVLRPGGPLRLSAWLDGARRRQASVPPSCTAVRTWVRTSPMMRRLRRSWP